MEDLRQDLRAVTKDTGRTGISPSPELKAAWEEGHKDLFYPYGKTFLQTVGEQD